MVAPGGTDRAVRSVDGGTATASALRVDYPFSAFAAGGGYDGMTDDLVEAAEKVQARPEYQHSLTKHRTKIDGPCPLCGGDDRFRLVSLDGRIMGTCSQEDGHTNGELRELLTEWGAMEPYVPTDLTARMAAHTASVATGLDLSLIHI